MSATWWLSLAILSPLLAWLATLWLPRGAITPRVLLATAGTALSFILLLSHIGTHGVGEVPLAKMGQGPAIVQHDADVAGAGHGSADAMMSPANDAMLATDSIRWLPRLNLNFAYLTDGLGLFFALLVSGIGVLIVLYARGYFGRDEDALYRFYPTLGFFTSAMLGVVMADYLLLTLLFWECTTVSSFLLIGWDRYDKHTVKLAMQAFFTTALGGLALFGGMVLFGLHTDIWRWSTLLTEFDITAVMHEPTIFWAFVMMFLGAATKSAQWPWHYWLPGAMAAPTPVSAFLHSATMVKAGVFLAGRMFPVFSQLEPWPWLLMIFGAVTMLLGGIIALNQHDLKRIFAYTTVSQLGLLMCMYGMGGLTFAYHDEVFRAIDFDITQIANHAFYKAPLFIAAGAIGHYVSRDITQLHGAYRKQPMICLTMLLAGYALAALPGSISFQAKELFLYGIYNLTKVHPVFWLLMAMTVATAVCNMAIFVRLFTTLLGLPGGMNDTMTMPPVPDDHDEHVDHVHDSYDDHGHDDHEHEHEHEHGPWATLIWLPGMVLVLLQFAGGLFPGLFWTPLFSTLEPATAQHYVGQAYAQVPNLWQIITHPGVPLMMSLLAVVGGLALGLSSLMRRAIVDVHDQVYPAMYWLAVTGGGSAFRMAQTGYLRHYSMFALCSLIVGFTIALAFDPSMFEPVLDELPKTFEFWPGILLGAIICVTALALPGIRSRVVRVLLLGACGFTVVGMYLVYQAPDLALTQLMVEIISVILFVLVLRLLPHQEPRPATAKPFRIALSVAVGVVVAWMTILAAVAPESFGPHEMLGEFFAKHSYEGSEVTGGRGGGGTNIVNVILVDFRGLDTLGEIVVLALAAIGVWSLVPSRKERTI